MRNFYVKLVFYQKFDDRCLAYTHRGEHIPEFTS